MDPISWTEFLKVPMGAAVSGECAKLADMGAPLCVIS